MKAAISGRAAAAIVLDGDEWLRIDGDDPTRLKPAGPHEWRFVFGVSEDIQYVEAGTFDEIRQILSMAVDENHALTLTLICLDMGSEFQTKIEAAQHLESILHRTDSVLPFLWRVFTAKPLPRDASPDDAYAASSGESRAFLERLRRSQPAIQRVHEAWQTLSDDCFARVSREDLRSFAIHRGIWNDFVEAAFEDRTPSVPSMTDLPSDWSAAQVRQIFLAWSERVAERIAMRPLIRIETYRPAVMPIAAEDRTLFAATDADMEALQPIDFHGSLINNLLLRRNLVIPDIYFFTSRGLAAHLSTPNTLLEHALAAGFLVVACRYRGADFETAYRIMRRQRLVSRRCDYVVRLQHAAEKSQNGAFLYWPVEGVSIAYERYLSVLEGDAPPPTALHAAGDSALERNWELTCDWRMSLIDQAREATQRHGGTGVYKRELFRQLVKAVVGHAAPEITGIGSLLSIAKELADKVRTFWAWAAEGHRFSRAQMLDAQVYSPGYERVQNLFVTSALGSLADSNPLRLEVELPSTSSLKQLKPQRIIELRSGAGADYFRAVDDCLRNPEHREPMKNALQQYAAEVVKVSAAEIGRIKVKRVELSIGLPSSPNKEAARRQQFLAMTTFDSFPGKLYDQYRPGGKIGTVTVNKQTDVCVTNDLPEITMSPGSDG